MKDLKQLRCDHICRFNDGEQKCECWIEGAKSLLLALREGVEERKTDERKVAVFGEWQAETYEEKMLVNAVVSDISTLITEVINSLEEIKWKHF